MKEIDGLVKIKKYTDDDGRPVCGGCIMLQDSGERYECDFEGDDIYPGPLCPIWNGESKSDKCLSLLKEARLCLEMWKDVAPAVSLCADIDKFLQEK